MPREPGWARRSWKRAGWDLSLSHAALYLHLHHGYIHSPTIQILDCYPVCARSALAQRACALGAKGLLLADGAPTVERGKTFWRVNRIFFTRTAVTPKRKVKKLIPRWEMNGLYEGYKWVINQNWGRMAKIGFFGKKPKISFWVKTHF